MDWSGARWQGLLRDLQKELETMNSNLRSLELENLRMREVLEARPRLELSRQPSRPSQALDLFSQSSKADRSWSLALVSANVASKVQKGAFGRADIMKSVSFENTMGDVDNLETFEIDTSIGSTVSSKAEKDAGPVRGILKKNSSYRISIAPETASTLLSQESSLSSPLEKSQGMRSSLEEDKTHFAILRGQKTRIFMLQKPWYVINPDSTIAATIWQCITTTALVWVALVTPLQVGLVKMEVDWVFLSSVIVDAIFFIDMILQFCTTYVRRTPRGDEWEVRVKNIILHYLSTWFVLDFITLIPFELVAVIVGDEALKELTIVKVIRVLRLLKLTRLLRSSRLAQRLEAPISLPYHHLALLRCVLVLILLCHWLACLWASMLTLVPDGTPTWIDEIAAVDEVFGIDTRNSPLRIYVASFYFCSYTMTSVGYGDIGPQNVFERVACTLMLLGAGLSWACVLGEVCAIVAEMNAESQDFRKKMHHLNWMMGDQGLPGELRRRLRAYFLQNRHQTVFATHKRLLQQMSPQLQAEVCTVVNLPWLRKVPFFHNFLQHIEAMDLAGMSTSSLHACIADVSQELESTAYAQRESFNNVQVLHILAKGLVVLNTRVASNGAVWGEDFVLADVPLIQKISGFALTYVEILCLKRENFINVIERRRNICPELGQIVRRYCVRIAVYRGILAEARRLKLLKAEEERSEKLPQGQLAPVEQVPPAMPGLVEIDD